MTPFSATRVALKRGGLIAIANWQVIVIQFVAESTFKLMLAVPLVGGALLVAIALGGDLRGLLSGDAWDILTEVAGALAAQPVALVAFLIAFTIVLLGGAVVLWLLKGGTISVLAIAEWTAGRIEHPPLRLVVVRRASTFTVERYLEGCGRFFGRLLRLGVTLLVVYGVSGALYVMALVRGARLVVERGDSGVEALTAIAQSAGLIAWIAVVNLLYLLVQMIVVVEDRPVAWAARQLLRFLRVKLREVATAFALVLGLVVVATMLSVVAMTGLGLVAFVPIVGLAVLPLQLAAWLLRGLVFQYVGLAALGAYLSLYRSVSQGAIRATPGAGEATGDQPLEFTRAHTA